VLLGNESRRKWHTIDPTRIGNGIINSGKAYGKDNATLFGKADDDNPQYGVHIK